MGICLSGGVKGNEPEVKEEPKKADDLVVRVLLLGAGGSGKSTLFKQFKNLYGKGLPKEEREYFKDGVYVNVIQGIKVLLIQSDKYALGDPDGDPVRPPAPEHAVAPQLAEAKQIINDLPVEGPVDGRIGPMIKALWADPGIQLTYKRRQEYQFYDSGEYFFSRLDAIMQPDYIPSEADCLRCRVSTTGIVSEQYEIDGTMFSVTDVGGQRSERKRWAHCLKNLDAVCFVCAMSAYNQNLYEDANVNRLQEAMDLFEVICNSEWFENVSKFVFLNKSDLFREKVEEVPIAHYFKQFSGEPTYEDGLAFLKDCFRDLNYASTELHIYVTCATDPNNIREVFNECKVKMLEDIQANRAGRQRAQRTGAAVDDDTDKKIRGIAKVHNQT